MYLVVRTKDRLKSTMLKLKEHDILTEALAISTLEFQKPQVTSDFKVDAYIATSPKAILTIPKDKYPVFCVGKATAEEADDFGLRSIYFGDGNAEDMARQIVRQYPKQKILHVAGDTAETEWYSILQAQGFEVRKGVGYTTKYISQISQASAEKMNAGSYKAYLFYSAGGASHFVKLAAEAGVDLSKLKAIAFSAQVEEALKGFGSILQATTPTEDEVIRLIQQEIEGK